MNRLLPPYAVPRERRPSKAALVPGIRPAVDQWRAQGYPGATDTTKHLLQYWFEQDHRVRRQSRPQEFGYYFCQREAIETLIYLYEVRQLRSLYDLARNFPPERPFLISPQNGLPCQTHFHRDHTVGGVTVKSCPQSPQNLSCELTGCPAWHRKTLGCPIGAPQSGQCLQYPRG